VVAGVFGAVFARSPASAGDCEALSALCSAALAAAAAAAAGSAAWMGHLLARRQRLARWRWGDEWWAWWPAPPLKARRTELVVLLGARAAGDALLLLFAVAVALVEWFERGACAGRAPGGGLARLASSRVTAALGIAGLLLAGARVALVRVATTRQVALDLLDALAALLPADAAPREGRVLAGLQAATAAASGSEAARQCELAVDTVLEAADTASSRAALDPVHGLVDDVEHASDAALAAVLRLRACVALARGAVASGLVPLSDALEQRLMHAQAAVAGAESEFRARSAWPMPPVASAAQTVLAAAMQVAEAAKEIGAARDALSHALFRGEDHVAVDRAVRRRVSATGRLIEVAGLRMAAAGQRLAAVEELAEMRRPVAAAGHNAAFAGQLVSLGVLIPGAAGPGPLERADVVAAPLLLSAQRPPENPSQRLMAAARLLKAAGDRMLALGQHKLEQLLRDPLPAPNVAHAQLVAAAGKKVQVAGSKLGVAGLLVIMAAADIERTLPRAAAAAAAAAASASASSSSAAAATAAAAAAGEIGPLALARASSRQLSLGGGDDVKEMQSLVAAVVAPSASKEAAEALYGPRLDEAGED
jgi:hypothetical protein